METRGKKMNQPLTRPLEQVPVVHIARGDFSFWCQKNRRRNWIIANTSLEVSGQVLNWHFHPAANIKCPVSKANWEDRTCFDASTGERTKMSDKHKGNTTSVKIFSLRLQTSDLTTWLGPPIPRQCFLSHCTGIQILTGDRFMLLNLSTR